MDRYERTVLTAALLVLLTLVATAAVVPDLHHRRAWGRGQIADLTAASASASPAPAGTAPTGTATAAPAAPTTAASAYPLTLPHGETAILGDDRFLVAYYGTADTGSLGVLGETDPDTAFHRLTRAAAPFARKHSPVQPVYELIVTVADGRPGGDGSYSHEIPRAAVQRYIDAAHRHGVLLLLDVQPGRTDFLTAAKRWGWALHDPYVGLALDPEWRMGRHQVPARVIGSVGAPEINRTSAWLRDLVARNHLPQKLFVLHQFRTSMIRDLGAVRSRAGLVTVQHVDGYGTPGQKLGTFHTVARPDRFVLGFKLFYDEDVHRMTAAQVRRIRPPVRFVSFQ